jgi:hypothetical protein
MTARIAVKANSKARVSDETFDEFLAKQGMLESCEDRALEELDTNKRLLPKERKA